MFFDEEKWEKFQSEAPKSKIEKHIETYNYVAPLTKQVEDLDMACSCLQK